MDNFENILSRALSHLEKNGLLFVFDAFNEFHFDVITRFRDRGRPELGWQAGYNHHSREGIECFLKANGYKADWIPFEMKNDLPPKATEPSSYTFRGENKKNIFLTTTGQYLKFFLVKINTATQTA